MGSSRFYRIFYIQLVFMLAAAYAVFWFRIGTTPDFLPIRDFTIFVTALNTVEEAGWTTLYHIETQSEIQSAILDGREMGGGLLPFNHPPYLLPLMGVLLRPALNVSYGLAFFVWTLINYGVLLLCGLLSLTLLRDDPRGEGLSRRDRLLLLAPVVLFYPVHIALFQGQDMLFTLFGVLLWAWGSVKRRDPLAGLGLALTTLMPHLTLLLAVPTFFRSARRFGWFTLWATALVGLSLWLIRVEGVVDFLHMISETGSAEGVRFGVFKGEMVNLTGLLARHLPQLAGETLSLLSWGIYVVVMISLSVMSWRRSAADRPVDLSEIGLLTLVATLCVTHLHFHGLAALWVSILAAGLAIFSHYRLHPYLIGCGLAGASLLLLPYHVGALPFKYAGSYLIAAVCIAIFWQTGQTRRENTLLVTQSEMPARAVDDDF